MKPRNRALQKQRDGWRQSPDRRNFTPSNHAAAFTLVDEARQTSHHDSSFWGQNTQLRKKPVAFVSSGSHDPLTSPQIQTDDNEESSNTAEPPREVNREQPLLEDASSSDEVIVFKGRNPIKRKTEAPEITKTPRIPQTAEATQTTKAIQTPEGTQTSEAIRTPETTQTPETPQSPEAIQTPEINQATEATRTPEGTHAAKVTHAVEITLTSMQTEIRAVEKQLSIESKESHVHQTKAEEKKTKDEDDENSDGLLWPRKKSNKSRRQRNWGENSEEDAILADYIANMRQNGEMMDEISEDDSGSTTSDDAGDHPSTSLGPKDTEDVDIYSEAEYKPRGSLFGEPNDNLDKRESKAISKSSSREKLKEKSPFKDPPNTYMNSFTELEYLEEQTDFDLMDWERPSVRRRKGKAGRLLLASEDIDSDLEEKLQAAYSNDRQKKAQRKREREELRATGMLGKRSQPDLQAKYRTGITMSQVADEIKTFLAGSQEMLTLPPMDKRTRKLVHQLANKFNIKSKSIGAENQRKPVLTKTKKTSYKEAAFDQAVSRIKRQYSSQPMSGNKQQFSSSSSARNNAAASYQDGEVIGAHAPELGTGNRGRTMLEKMGWSTGTALGTSDNQGILHPVSQTMKRSRAGLGQ